VTGNWWDNLGTPQYGGTITLRLDRDVVNFDSYSGAGMSINAAFEEKIHCDDWTLNPAVFDYRIGFRPNNFVKGNVAATWEITDPGTYVIHLRPGIHWQDIPPANGREFVADDVVFHYNRMYALGGGFTKPSTFASSASIFKNLKSVTATDKYTVVFVWNTTNPESIMENMQTSSSDQFMENPEAIRQWGDVVDWHHAIGTGPFILKDFVTASSATLVRNPNYWGYDERYPQNKLPYADQLKILIMPDNATAMAAMRSGKIDVMSQISFANAQSIQKTNPEIVQLGIPMGQASTVDPRNDTAPFNDIRVRQAMQLSIDLPSIAKSFYQGTAEPYPASMTSRYMKGGYGFPYEDWPQDLKDQYAYNPTAAKQLLAAAGFPSGFKTTVIADAASDLDLLQIVKSYFAAVGIDLTIQTMDSPSWIAFVRNNKKYDQVAFPSSGDLGFTYEPLRQLNRYLTGYTANYNMVSDPVYDTFAPKAAAANNLNDIKQALKDANERVARQHYVISLLQPNLFELSQPWLKGYNGQNNAFWGGTNGPQLLGFYAGRFWIDQNLKKSMGH
jgi:peptide/nickel transport system substrate-binding protein